MSRRGVSASLPVFPWDTLADVTAKARAHADGIVDLSVGTPVDPVAPVIREALAAASASPGYPTTAGTSALRASASAALTRRYGITGLAPDAVLPVIGTKELIAWLPTLLGLGAADLVVVPELAYPTYDVGAQLAGATVVAADSLTQLGPQSPAVVFLNSPSNPTGQVLGVDHLRKVVGWARERGAIIASDECYLGLGWADAAPVSVLHPSVSDGDHTGLLAIHSLSKTSSLAGYRAGFVAGDPALVAELLAVRKHAGMMVPTPVQAAMVAALDDDVHEKQQRERYARRREVLLPAVRAAGFTVEHSEAGLYLWATRGEPCRDTVAWLAERGILVAPGEFYGARGARHVRIALTATDERIDAAVARLA
ncbi:succinyldiaminopimelate transaminase [soil metagenome]